jgi:hypothetical protein
MTVIRFSSGDLVVLCPVQISDVIYNQLSNLGRIAYIIAPNLYHHLFVSDFKAAFPEAQLWVPPGLDAKRPDIVVDRIMTESEGTLLDELEYLFFDGFKLLDLKGIVPANEFVFFHRATRSLILTDIAFHFDESFSLKTRFAAQLIGTYKLLRPSYLEKLATTDKQRVKQAVQTVLRWDFDRVIMAHGRVIETGGKQRFKEGFEWFLNTSI